MNSIQKKCNFPIKLQVFFFITVLLFSVNVMAKKPNFSKAKKDTAKYIKKSKKFRVKIIKKDGKMFLARTSDVQRKYGKYAPKNKLLFPLIVKTRKKDGVTMRYTGNAVYMRPIMSKKNNWKFRYFDITNKKMIGGAQLSMEQFMQIVIEAMNSKERRRSWFGSSAKYIHSISNIKIIMEKFLQKDANQMEFWVQYTFLKKNSEKTVVKKVKCIKLAGKWVLDGYPRPGRDIKYRGSSTIYHRNIKRDELKAMPNLYTDGFSKVNNYKFKK